MLYWNTRKSLFRMRRGRVAPPCQSPSDSGRAYETRCDACLQWAKQERFRRVCPLLVETSEGLRCSVDSPAVRPFWGIAFRWYGGSALAIYAVAVLTVFGFLRTIGYPVSILQVGLPPLWHEIGAARGWFFLKRSQEAFAAGRTNEGLLFLSNSYDFDPGNYSAGLALAKAFQLSQVARSDEIFAKLYADHEAERPGTAQQWFRALLARGDFDRVVSLATDEIERDPGQANAWMRAAIFASRQARTETALRALLAKPTQALRIWRPVLETELLFHANRIEEVRAAVARPWPASLPPYSFLYQAEMLVLLGNPDDALDLLVQHRIRLDDEAYFTLRLRCLAAAGATRSLRSEFKAILLDPPLNQARLKMMCAQLIRYPDPELFAQLQRKLEDTPMPLTDETAGGWFSLLCTAGALGDLDRLNTLMLRLRNAAQTPFTALQMVEAFFRGQMSDPRATTFLPFLPVPLEVGYALIERYPGKPRPAATPP